MHGTKASTRGIDRDPMNRGLRTPIVEFGDASNAWLELPPKAMPRLSPAPPDYSLIAKKNAVAEVATDVFVLNRPVPARPRAQLHVRCPCGSGCVQFLVAPSFVMTTFAVAEPSYVITSRRIFVAGASLPTVTVTFIERVTEPAVG
jgi:hypothetical protein